MKHIASLALLIAIVGGTAIAQLTITGTTPVNAATNVAASTTISITFSAAIDSSILQHTDRGVFTNIDTIQVIGLSPDKRTISFSAHLTPGRVHYIAYYYVKAASGADLTDPVVFYFTTAASFPPSTVSGTVLAGSSGVDPGGCLVILSDGPIGDGKPNLIIGTVTSAGGAFTIPYVAEGGYYPIAAKDANHNGEIDPTRDGDPISQGDSITVTGANITGLLLSLSKVEPLTFRAAYDSAMAFGATLPVGHLLKALNSYEPDSTGAGSDWNFDFWIPSSSLAIRIRVGAMDKRVDTLDYWNKQMVGNCRALTGVAGAAELSLFMSNCENAGGRTFRTQTDTLQFQRYFALGDQRWNEYASMVTDTSKNYWSASYWWGISRDTLWIQKRIMRFLGDFQTGAILKTTDVRPSTEPAVPEQIALSQNYPNPFNPTTQVSFALPSTQRISLAVYNVLGEQLAVVAEGTFGRGSYDVLISGEGWPSGIYFCVLHSAGAPMVRKMVLMR